MTVLRWHMPWKSGHVTLRYSIDPETGCWCWQGATHEAGDGIVGTNRDGTTRAHRVAHIAVKGPTPEGLQRDHLGRNRACINPEPLEPVTNAQNSQRGAKAKLTCQQVREIRRLGASTQLSQRELARRLGIHPTTVQNILAGKRWRETT